MPGSRGVDCTLRSPRSNRVDAAPQTFRFLPERGNGRQGLAVQRLRAGDRRLHAERAGIGQLAAHPALHHIFPHPLDAAGFIHGVSRRLEQEAQRTALPHKALHLRAGSEAEDAPHAGGGGQERRRLPEVDLLFFGSPSPQSFRGKVQLLTAPPAGSAFRRRSTNTPSLRGASRGSCTRPCPGTGGDGPPPSPGGGRSLPKRERPLHSSLPRTASSSPVSCPTPPALP